MAKPLTREQVDSARRESREAMRALRNSVDLEDGWDDRSEVTGNIIVQPGGVVNVDQTGKFAAVEAATRPDNPKPSAPPSSAPQVAKGLALVMREANSWPKVVALALLVLLLIVVIAWRVRVAIAP